MSLYNNLNKDLGSELGKGSATRVVPGNAARGAPAASRAAQRFRDGRRAVNNHSCSARPLFPLVFLVLCGAGLLVSYCR